MGKWEARFNNAQLKALYTEAAEQLGLCGRDKIIERVLLNFSTPAEIIRAVVGGALGDVVPQVGGGLGDVVPQASARLDSVTPLSDPSLYSSAARASAGTPTTPTSSLKEYSKKQGEVVGVPRGTQARRPAAELTPLIESALKGFLNEKERPFIGDMATLAKAGGGNLSDAQWAWLQKLAARGREIAKQDSLTAEAAGKADATTVPNVPTIWAGSMDIFRLKEHWEWAQAEHGLLGIAADVTASVRAALDEAGRDQLKKADCVAAKTKLENLYPMEAQA